MVKYKANLFVRMDKKLLVKFHRKAKKVDRPASQITRELIRLWLADEVEL